MDQYKEIQKLNADHITSIGKRLTFAQLLRYAIFYSLFLTAVLMQINITNSYRTHEGMKEQLLVK
jgi:hypothetical protein